jgi:hypothetical protein
MAIFRMKGNSRSKNESSLIENQHADPGCASRCCAKLMLTSCYLNFIFSVPRGFCSMLLWSYLVISGWVRGAWATCWSFEVGELLSQGWAWADQKGVWTATFTECFPQGIIRLLSLYCHLILSVMVAQIFSYARSPPQLCRNWRYRWYMLRCLELFYILLGWLWLFSDVFFLL